MRPAGTFEYLGRLDEVVAACNASLFTNSNANNMDPVQQQIDDARRILYDVDPATGNIRKSKLYEIYQKNAAAYAKAKSAYAAAYARASSDPAALQAWPIAGTTYQHPVDNAWNDWVSEGKLKVENALAVIGTCGNSPETQLRQQQT